jgi:hypothetical protein
VRQRGSWLDQMVYRFQHRWETSAQYRATTAGVVGLVVLVAMCTCTGAMATAANAALSSIGLGGSAAGPDSANTGTQQLRAQDAFPTFTIPAYTPVALPVGTIPDSQTPMPGPTPTPTTVATPTNTPGGPSNTPTTCNGGSGGGSWAFTPCPVVGGQSVTITVVDRHAPGSSLYVVVNFGPCGSTCTWLLYPSLDGAGTWSYTATVPSAASNSGVPITGMVKVQSNGNTMLINAEPVQ